MKVSDAMEEIAEAIDKAITYADTDGVPTAEVEQMDDDGGGNLVISS